MDMDPIDFLDVPLNKKGPNSCSPHQVDPKWRGILIRAPRLVRVKKNEVVGDYGSFAAIPICGFYLADVRIDLPPEPFRLFAVDQKTRKTYEGPIVELDPSPKVPPPNKRPLSQKDVEGLASGGYFNPNLVDFVVIPRASAIYEVHIEFRELKSNVVTIELVLEKE